MPERTAHIRRDRLGALADGRPIDAFTLDNGRGLSLTAINLGGIVTSLRCPDLAGEVADVVLGFKAVDDYLAPHPHFGTLVGRFANRIEGAAFELDGRVHALRPNDGPHTLHGGPRGFGQRWWDIEPDRRADGSVALRLALVSEDGDQGFPGRLDVEVQYTLTPEGEWRIDQHARCDRPTVVNLSHHGYYNLAGAGSALDHELTIPASRFLEVDAGLIPTRVADVAGSPFDFRAATRIGARIDAAHPQLRLATGYDHCWILDHAGDGLRPAARLADRGSGRVLDILTSEPAIQFYSGNFLDGSLTGRAGRAYRRGDGVCLETQHFPNAPNRPDFPPTVLRPGQTFTSSTVHRFSVQPQPGARADPARRTAPNR